MLRSLAEAALHCISLERLVTSEIITCSDCAGELEEGFLLDANGGVMFPSKWHAGAPKNSTFFGVDVGGTHGVEIRQAFPIGAARCTQFGMLKLHARPSQRSE